MSSTINNSSFIMQQREEKHLDASVEALSQRVAEMKASITSLLYKLENEYTTLNWPTVLDNFALLSGQISSLNKVLKNDKTPVFRNYVLLPLVLAPEKDEDLEKLTEGRVSAFNHEVVPDYLRTKPEPEAEEKVHTYSVRASTISQDHLQKQMNMLNKLSTNVVEMINTEREKAESELTKSQMAQTSNLSDTHLLIAAVSNGKGLKSRRLEGGHPGPGVSPGLQGDQRAGMPLQPGQQGGYHTMYGGHGGMPVGVTGKAPSTIKTNIKAATSIHPYNRP